MSDTCLDALLSTRDGQIGLLTLPREDLRVTGDSASSGDTTPPSSFVLLQLPVGWQARDLRDAHFVANRSQQVVLVSEAHHCSFTAHRVETSNVLVLVPPRKTTNHQANAAADANDTGAEAEAGFALHDTQAADGDTPWKRDTDEPASREWKKAKLAAPRDASPLVPVPARLLKPGGIGSSFLELRPTVLARNDLQRALRQALPPNDAEWNPQSYSDCRHSDRTRMQRGRTVAQLANYLQTSTQQIRNGLAALPQAFPLPHSHNNNNNKVHHQTTSFVYLSEVVLQDILDAIVATLAEVDDCSDYAQHGVLLHSVLIPEALQRLSPPVTTVHTDDANLLLWQALIRHGVDTLRDESCSSPHIPSESDTDCEPRTVLTVSKVARLVARRLFQMQTAPWEERRFLARWQSELPGVGHIYAVHVAMLRGLAIRNEGSSTERSVSDRTSTATVPEEATWRYLAADQVVVRSHEHADPTTTGYPTESYFDVLFQTQSLWTLDALQPYLDYLVVETATTQADLLLRHTKLIIRTDPLTGATLQFFTKR
ncbi:predicted protein [Phaeodactylum tricornutum CCAP 1055/1]|uniref:Sister chromatid cohesion protein DCC1 n=1 Tax=Phaeodactylum tricornutum (strain CCAP 1055/1) TaxID=556484 RepID=B7GAX2_PHATC|nr:predicted protein [Phaeodactylum tricornutum CCAP 1055/1]EEC44447.1 predicted protein [Phaeodactylum tricornutum CCAP 1055/1]|eukprot:XP_002184269.1 predicted protein [Phaeodactylum tricornutum CCAP 1055/1]